MIGGRVTEFLEAVIPLTVIGCGNLRVEIDVVIDTGFRRATLADGSVVALPVYLGNVEWHGEVREVLVIGAAGGALAGMSLLNGSRIVLDVVANGDVSIAPSR